MKGATGWERRTFLTSEDGMKRALWLTPVLAFFSLVGCAEHYYGYGYYAPPPPALRAEVYGYAPGPGYVWIGGYWNWDRGYHWVPGSWARPPRPHAVWVPGRAHYDHGRYYYERGRWR